MKRLLPLFAALAISYNSNAQAVATAPKQPAKYKPMKFNLNEDGSQYIRMITWLQMWATSNQDNPGTVGYDGKSQTSHQDIAIRRARMLFYAQLSPGWMILTHFGINNQAFNVGGVNGTDGKKPQMYIHDAWTEFAVVPKKLSLGMGIHYFNGVSRSANASTLTFMTMDAPIFNWYTIETNDQFARQMGIFAKGQLGKLDYRLALNKPFLNGVNPYTQTAKTTNGFNTDLAAKNAFTQTFSQSGYVKYMFLDQESNLLPFETGTYLGGKKVFNIGLGFYNHPKSTYTLSPGTGSDSLKLHNTTIIGADVFYDAPISKKGHALSIYGLYQTMNYGDNYLRNISILNVAPSVGTAAQLGADYANRSVMGAGNLQPTLGTGKIFYLQAGLKFPNFKNGAALMPYVTYTNKSFDAIGKASSQMDLGLNYFISGHNAKVTLQYSTRPVYKFDAASSNGISQNGSKGQFTVQTHIFL